MNCILLVTLTGSQLTDRPHTLPHTTLPSVLIFVTVSSSLTQSLTDRSSSHSFPSYRTLSFLSSLLLSSPPLISPPRCCTCTSTHSTTTRAPLLCGRQTDGCGVLWAIVCAGPSDTHLTLPLPLSLSCLSLPLYLYSLDPILTNPSTVANSHSPHLCTTQLTDLGLKQRPRRLSKEL
jgi:hypothetical protein